MDSMIKGLFGGGDDDNDRRTQANDFISRYEQGPPDQGYSDDEAYEHFQRVSQHADPDTIQRASEQAFSRMDPQQRAQFAQQLQQQQQGGGQMDQFSDDPRQMAGMMSQMHRQNPSGLAGLLGGGCGGGMGGALGGLLGGGGGGGGFPGGTMGKMALGGIAAYAMKEMMGGGNDDNNRGRRRSI
ncbi:MAG: hypothetical protein M3457_14730 [Chloroflexota bacterium]|nr:hypothetical protein [Chloroflexota bacterium]